MAGVARIWGMNYKRRMNGRLFSKILLLSLLLGVFGCPPEKPTDTQRSTAAALLDESDPVAIINGEALSYT